MKFADDFDVVILKGGQPLSRVYFILFYLIQVYRAKRYSMLHVTLDVVAKLDLPLLPCASGGQMLSNGIVRGFGINYSCARQSSRVLVLLSPRIFRAIP